MRLREVLAVLLAAALRGGRVSGETDPNDIIHSTTPAPVRHCSCVWYPKPGRLDCGHKHCHGVATPKHDNITVFLLNNNDIHGLPDFSDVLPGYAKLHTIDLSHNSITAIRNTTFKYLAALEHLNLSFNSLTSLDGDVLFGTAKIKSLKLRYNKLTRVVADTFESIAFTLEDLDLSNNRIEVIEDGALGNMGRLRTLNLANNLLASVSDRLFEDLVNVRSLSLHGNKIQVLEKGVFRMCSLMEELDLSHNRLAQIDRFAFRGLESLQRLDLGYNQLGTTPGLLDLHDLVALTALDMDAIQLEEVGPETVRFPHTLRNLSLSECPHLKAIADGAFLGLHVLTSIEICGNRRLTTISHHAFTMMPNLTHYRLQHASLRDNALKSLPADLLPWRLVSSLDLGGNPWHCDCHSLWMTRDLPPPVKGSVICSSPAAVAGLRVTSVPSRELEVCWHQGSELTPLMMALLGVLGLLVLIILTISLQRSRACFRRRKLSDDSYRALYTSELDEEAATLQLTVDEPPQMPNGAQDLGHVPMQNGASYSIPEENDSKEEEAQNGVTLKEILQEMIQEDVGEMKLQENMEEVDERVQDEADEQLQNKKKEKKQEKILKKLQKKMKEVIPEKVEHVKGKVEHVLQVPLQEVQNNLEHDLQPLIESNDTLELT